MLPLTAIRSMLFGKAMVSSGFAVGGGALAADAAVADALARCRLGACRHARLPQSRAARRARRRSGEGWHHKTDSHAGFVRPLAADDDAELKAIPRKQRAEVRKALGGALTVETGTGPADRAAHYAVYAESVRNLGTPVFPRRLFAAVLDRFGDDADILTVRHDGARPIASVLSLYHNGTVMPYWGGGTREARTMRANELMYFALMRHARARGCTRVRFRPLQIRHGAVPPTRRIGGSSRSRSPMRSAPADGAEVRDVNPLSPKYRAQIAMWKKLPLWLANRLGPPLARGLG